MLGELSPASIEEVLRENAIGRIGAHALGRTYVIPITYVYEDGAVYAHGRPGMKFHMMRENPRVCFEVDVIDDLANWKSVIAWGIFEELHGERAESALQLLVNGVESKLAGPPGASVHPRSGLEPSIVYRVVLEEKTGRFERRS